MSTLGNLGQKPSAWPIKTVDRGSGQVAVEVSPVGSVSVAKNITATTNIKTGKGRVARVSVIATGTATGSVHDKGDTVGLDDTNKLAIIPAAVGVTYLDMPVDAGITIVPGLSQVIVVSYL